MQRNTLFRLIKQLYLLISIRMPYESSRDSKRRSDFAADFERQARAVRSRTGQTSDLGVVYADDFAEYRRCKARAGLPMNSGVNILAYGFKVPAASLLRRSS